MKRAEQIIEPIMLSKEEAKLLKQDKGTLALKLKRTSYIEKDIPVEYTISIFRSDRYLESDGTEKGDIIIHRIELHRPDFNYHSLSIAFELFDSYEKCRKVIAM